MPELRRGVRASPLVDKNNKRFIAANHVKTRAAAAREAAATCKKLIVGSVSQTQAPMADASGGLSANKVTGQEEEGNTAPFPDRVGINTLFFLFHFSSFFTLIESVSSFE